MASYFFDSKNEGCSYSAPPSTVGAGELGDPTLLQMPGVLDFASVDGSGPRRSPDSGRPVVRDRAAGLLHALG